jgi:hypothetical protein
MQDAPCCHTQVRFTNINDDIFKFIIITSTGKKHILAMVEKRALIWKDYFNDGKNSIINCDCYCANQQALDNNWVSYEEQSTIIINDLPQFLKYDTNGLPTHFFFNSSTDINQLNSLASDTL